jgi:D-tyrosyl-tRNA(Tyr) deacylase
MRAVVQRVTRAQVTVNDDVVGRISRGLVVLLGVGNADAESDADYMADKIIGLRIFDDENGKMNLAVSDIRGEILVVSQFTLYGDVRRGKRPSFDAAAPPNPPGSCMSISWLASAPRAYSVRSAASRKQCR